MRYALASSVIALSSLALTINYLIEQEVEKEVTQEIRINNWVEISNVLITIDPQTEPGNEVIFERTVHKDVVGDFRAWVWDVELGTSSKPVCYGEGKNINYTKAEPNIKIWSLAFWIDDVNCRREILGDGSFINKVEWVFTDPETGETRKVDRLNVFQVKLSPPLNPASTVAPQQPYRKRKGE